MTKIRPELLSLSPEQQKALIAFAKQRGGPAAVEEALELERYLRQQSLLDSMEKTCQADRAEFERIYADGSLAVESAIRFVKSGGEPSLPPHRYSEAMMKVAEADRRQGETVERAAARLCGEGYGTEAGSKMAALFEASRYATALEAKRAADLARETAPARLAKRAGIEQRMKDYTKASTRPGETPEQASARLLGSDQTFQGMYADYRALSY